MDRTNGRTWWRILLATGTFAVWTVAGADEIILGVGETHVFTNAEDAVQTEAVRLADRTVLEKRGAGTLTLRGGAFTENQPVTVHVREGAVSVVSSEPLATAYAPPTEVMNRAAFWVDANRNVQLRTDGEAENEVAAWLDVRETGTGSEESPYLYTRAVAFTNEWLTAFPLAQSYLDKPGVYCRGSGSGCFLNWVKPDGTQQNIKGLRHVFIVHGGPTSAGHFLGQRTTQEPYFQRSGKIWADHNGENKPLFASRTYLDGRELDPFSSSYPAKSLHVVEVEALGDSLGAMCFYNDRDMQLTTTAGTKLTTEDGKPMNVVLGTSERTGGGDRVGGEYLCEALLFTNDLTVAERLAVSDWLNQKWRGVPPPAALPATTVALATNAVFEVTDGTDLTGITLFGGGVLRKTGAGAATLRSSYQPRNAAPRVQVEEGVLNLGFALPLVCAAGDTLVSERRPWGPELAPPEAGADTARLVKRGSGPVLLDSGPEGVTHLRVEGGELRLADPERARGLVPSAAETVEVTFPDADFETYPATGPTTAYSYIKDGEEANGWHAVVPGKFDDKSADSGVFFFDQRLGSPKDWWMVMQTPPTGVLAVKNNASAWCEIDIPSDGDYTLSFRAAPRSGYAGEQLDVMIGPDAESLVSFGAFRITTWNAPWRTFTFQKRRLTAGRYQFWLKAKMNNADRCTQFDGFRLVREADAGEWALPNGGFEEHTADFANAFTLANAACVPGFTVKQCARENNGTDREGTSSNTTFSVRGTDNHAHFNLPWNRPGSETQLYMSGIGSQLTTTFTPPAGTWRFRADFCLWATSWGTHGYKVAADLRIGETAVALGTVTNESYALLPRTWPGTFTVDGATPVTLTLTGGFRVEDQRFGHGLLDNLTLVRATGPGENLLRQGGFESMAPWQVTVTPKPTGVTGSTQQTYDGFSETVFGREAFEGKACMKIVNDDTVAQTVTFPTGGLYRLSANLQSRNAPDWPSSGCGQNPVAFFCARGGVTNWLGVTDTVAMTNFHEYAYLVRIPEEGGTYDVGFRGRSVWGGGTTVDRTTLVDAAQLYRVETARPLDLPETLEIDVAAGAQLTLDFDGTNEIRRLNVAGRSYVGSVSLADRPELLGTLAGRGTFFIRPRGTVLIVR